jgi:hypothetical protein
MMLNGFGTSWRSDRVSTGSKLMSDAIIGEYFVRHIEIPIVPEVLIEPPDYGLFPAADIYPSIITPRV